MPIRLAVLSLLLTVATATALQPAGAQDSSTAAASADSARRKLDGFLRFLQDRNARDYAITSPGGIDEGRYVTIGGIEQWITIRGEDRGNPVLLLLHGGPGDATNPWGYAGFRSWLRHFTVVQWDQRGAGRTFGKTGASIAPTITIERMTADGIELAELLRKDLARDKILLVGHSWGSILGNFMAKARPDLFSAFVATGLVADPARNYPVAYQAVVDEARRSGDSIAAGELAAVGPPPWPDGRGFGVQRKWANRFEAADGFLASMMGFAIAAPGYSAKDVTDWLEGQSVSAGQLVPKTAALTRSELAGRFEVPVLVIQGAEDFTTPTALAREFVAAIRAPSKAFVRLPGAGHFAVFMRQDAFLAALLARLGR